MTQSLTIAVPKGYLLQETVKCFENRSSISKRF